MTASSTPVRHFFAALLMMFLSFSLVPLHAFSPPKATAGPLTVEIVDPGEIAQIEAPVAISVKLRNAGKNPVKGVLRLAVTDEWRIEEGAERTFEVPGGGEAEIPCRVIAGRGTYAALYPIHARATFQDAVGSEQTANAILIVSVAPGAVAAAEPAAGGTGALTAPRRGPLRFDASTPARVIVAVNGQEPKPLPAGWKGSDPETGGSFAAAEVVRGDQRRALNMHPPYRKGWGEVFVDYRLALPETGSITLETATAIRDHNPAREGASDGVEFKVLVQDGRDGAFRPLFGRFSAAKIWEPVVVDLAPFAGREIVLRLSTGPGPKHNTSCDSAYWAEPLLWCGVPPQSEPEAARKRRRVAAESAAAAARKEGPGEWRWKVGGADDPIGVALVPGPNGMADAFLAIDSGKQRLLLDGFRVEIGGIPLGAGKAGLLCEGTEAEFAKGCGVLRYRVLTGDRSVPVETRVWAENGALRVGFSMPGLERDLRGEPRFTLLHPGPVREKVRRVYAGFGNVLENPGAFELRPGGFNLSTRHVGAEYANGLALVQATDIFPDFFRVDPAAGLCALATHHDATFSFVPSTRGAFAAARTYRDVASFQPAGGVGKLLGRMCLDQWGGDYRKAAEDLDKTARYGLTDAIFVKHSWQRWGYDYRLPDIWPPSGNLDDFLAMAAACRKHGILFAPHDNYIDFYPDADGYSYEHIVFDANGRPQKAWFNQGREAQSYRWQPTAFFPFLERNLQLIQKGASPTGYFIDVFTAAPPFDYYDRKGRFYPKMVTAERWGAAFDRVREVFGDHAPTISEAGADSLIGHLDAGEADHNRWDPTRKRGTWTMPAGDGERVPWHDMVSHGSFVLLAGGLGHRYAGEDNDQFLHGYGSDDYLGMTLLGGRNPMCDGPFSRRSVMTYWLLHDVCAGLARRELLSHEFVGDDIHRQVSRFGGDAVVRANRSLEDWKEGEEVLPPFGFVAQAGGCTASVVRRDGIITGFSSAPGVLFADARPALADWRGTAEPRVLGIEDLGGGKFRLKMEVEMFEPAPEGAKTYLNFHDTSTRHEKLIFAGNIRMDPAKLRMVGKHVVEADAAVPADVKLPARLAICCGLFLPAEGRRKLPMLGAVDRNGSARCGSLTVEKRKTGELAASWKAEPGREDIRRRDRLNLDGREIDFGPVRTNGAFRLNYGGPEWVLTPLPESPAFQVALRLERLGKLGARVAAVTAVDLDGKPLGKTAFREENGLLRFDMKPEAFACRIRFAE